jgi:hypothetical protein
MPLEKPASRSPTRQAAPLHVPKSRAEYCWSLADKDRLHKMVRAGRSYKEIAAQVGRTPTACSASITCYRKNDRSDSIGIRLQTTVPTVLIVPPDAKPKPSTELHWGTVGPSSRLNRH